MNPIGKAEMDIDELIDLLLSNGPHPEVSDLIYYEDNSAEEIVDKASWQIRHRSICIDVRSH